MKIEIDAIFHLKSSRIVVDVYRHRFWTLDTENNTTRGILFYLCSPPILISLMRIQCCDPMIVPAMQPITNIALRLLKVERFPRSLEMSDTIMSKINRQTIGKFSLQVIT